jgi:hypothetical protein
MKLATVQIACSHAQTVPMIRTTAHAPRKLVDSMELAPHTGHVSNFCGLKTIRSNYFNRFGNNSLASVPAPLSSLGTQSGHVSNSVRDPAISRCVIRSEYPCRRKMPGHLPMGSHRLHSVSKCPISVRNRCRRH